MKKSISYLFIILSAVCWGCIGFSNRLLTHAGMELGNRVFVRNFGTLVVLTIVFALLHREVFRIKLKHLPVFMASGLVSILLLSIVYFQCQTMCSLSVAAVLLYLAPSFVVLFSAVLWKTPLTKRKLAALAVSLLGCVLVSGILSGEASASWTGIALGVASGLTYASYTVFAHYGLAHYESYTMIYWTFVFAGLGSIFFADIPALIEAIVHDQAEELIRNHSTITTIEDALNVAVDSILQHRRAALHIFNSVSRDVYERYLMQICQNAVEKCFDAIIGERRVSPQDREILILSYRAWCFGLVIDWLDHGLKDDIHPTLTRMCELHKGMIEEMASRCIIE